jgi:uncharacterized protein HemX
MSFIRRRHGYAVAVSGLALTVGLGLNTGIAVAHQGQNNQGQNSNNQGQNSNNQGQNSNNQAQNSQ